MTELPRSDSVRPAMRDGDGPAIPDVSASTREQAIAHIEQALRARVGVSVIITWADGFEPQWSKTPLRYVEAGWVAWGRSRRLLKIEAPDVDLKSYLGIQAWDPGLWNLPGAPEAKFFLSIFAHGRTVSMRTFATGDGALDALGEALPRAGGIHRTPPSL